MSFSRSVVLAVLHRFVTIFPDFHFTNLFAGWYEYFREGQRQCAFNEAAEYSHVAASVA
jgi:hypothetical protein